MHLVDEVTGYASYLYRRDRGEKGRRKRKRIDAAKASAQLATSSLMKAVAAIQ